MNTLGLTVSNTDDEADLLEHLFRMTATDYLDMQSSQYKCLDRKGMLLLIRDVNKTSGESRYACLIANVAQFIEVCQSI